MRSNRRHHPEERSEPGDGGGGLSSRVGEHLDSAERSWRRGRRFQRGVRSFFALTLGWILIVAAQLPLDFYRTEVQHLAMGAWRLTRRFNAAIGAGLIGEDDARTTAILGLIAERGFDAEPDLVLAAHRYRAASYAGYAPAQYALGRLGLKERGAISLDETIWALEEASNAGIVDASRLLGHAMISGELGEIKPMVALVHLRRAGEAGDMEAAYTLGLALAEGAGLEKDPSEARRFLNIAVGAGHAAAAADLGLLVYQGRGGAADKESAARLFRTAAERADREGQYLWAFALAKGEGIGRDLIAAYAWVLRSMEGGSSMNPKYDQDRATLARALERALSPADQERARNRTVTLPLPVDTFPQLPI